MAVEKHRYCTFLVYPESAPDGWWETLKATHGMYARSLHDGDSEEQKTHYHVMYCHGNSTTDKALLSAIPAGIAANGHVEVCIHPRQYMRYLIHLDDPDKQQFPSGREHVECLNGFPLDLSREYTQEERAQQRRDVMKLIRDYDIVEYSTLLDGLMDTGDEALFDYAFNHTIAIDKYICSRRNARLYDGNADAGE